MLSERVALIFGKKLMPHFNAFPPLSKIYVVLTNFFRENTFLLQLGLIRYFDEIFGKCLSVK